MPLTMGMLKRPNSGGGVAPTIASIATYGASSNATSHVVSMPSGIASGDLLYAIIGTSSGATVTMPSGWSIGGGISGSGGNLNKLQPAWKIATGSEGSTMTITTGSSAGLVVIVFRITGNRSTVVNGTDFANYIQLLGNTSTPDPLANTAISWGTTNNLWINAIGYNSTSVSVSSYSSNYTLAQTIASTSGSASAYRIAVCARQLEASQDDPSAFVLSGSAYVLSIRPVIRPPS